MRERLEAELAAAWDADTLAVYADHLLAEGDPRGELIALDLEIAAHGNTVELSKRRTSLLYAWLGALVPVDNVHASWVGDSLRFGFVEDLRIESNDPNALARLEQVLASPAGRYIRGVTLNGTFEDVERAFFVLAKQDHPWLSRMTVGLTDGGGLFEVLEAFTRMPRLETLELVPQPAFAGITLPTIERLSIRGASVLSTLDHAAFPRVSELAIDLQPTMIYDYDEYYEEEPPPAPPHIALPSLRTLDLSRILDHETAYRVLRGLDARVHVTRLVIAQLRSAGERDDLVVATRDMPALETIEIAHGHYYDPPDLPNVTLVRPEPWPWPTPDVADSRGLRITMPGTQYGDTVALRDAVELMERSYESLAAPARTAWTEVWKLLRGMKQSGQLAASTLAIAVEACPELMQNGWRELREELAARRPFPPGALVTIERCS